MILSSDVDAVSVSELEQRSSRVRTEHTDGVFQIILSREDAQNAIDSAMASQLALAAHEIGQRDARCVLLRATGPSFSVGGDVREFGGLDGNTAVAATVDALHEALRTLAEARIPVVAAVHGWCVGAGIGLACTADVVIVAQGARFRSAYTDIGFTPDGGLTWVLPRIIGAIRARDAVLTNRVIGAEEAARWGLASRVVPEADLETQAYEVATELAHGARSALGTARTQLRRPDTVTYFDALDEEAAAVKAAAASAEGQEGMRAFLLRRRALFA